MGQERSQPAGEHGARFPIHPRGGLCRGPGGPSWRNRWPRCLQGRPHRRVPVRPSLVVNTFWDFGVDDSTSIWLHQRVGAINRFVKYFEDSGGAWPTTGACWRDSRSSATSAGVGTHPARWRRPAHGHAGHDLQRSCRGLGAPRNVEVVPRVQPGTWHRGDAADPPGMRVRCGGAQTASGCLDYWSREWDENKGHLVGEVKRQVEPRG